MKLVQKGTVKGMQIPIRTFIANMATMDTNNNRRIY